MEGTKNRGGRPRKIRTAAQMEELWEGYKYECDHQMVVTHAFSPKDSDFISAKLVRRIPYNIKGFCLFARLDYSTFYDSYANNPRFSAIVTRMREECEVDLLTKLATEEIPTRLAGLLLSKYGYTTKVDTGAEARAAALEEARKLLSGVPSVIGAEPAS